MARNNKGDMTFLEHLEELRWVIIRSLLAVAIGGVLAFIFRNIIFDDILLAPRSPEFVSNKLLCLMSKLINTESLCINQKPLKLISISMAGQFNTHIWVSIVSGFIISFPFVFYQFWSFIAPALHDKERRYARGAVLSSSGLFFLGVLFGYFVILPFSIDFLGNYSVSSQVTNQINLVSYISNTTSVVLASGIIFELPIVVFFLSKIGLMTPGFMRRYRRHAVIVILIVAAIITPPDWVSQTLVAIPLYLLYEVSIFISAAIARKRAAF